MIDTRRVRHMTKMAMFEQNESDDYKRVPNHSKKDYVGYWTVIYVIATIMFYLIYFVAGLSIILAVHPSGVPTIAWIVFLILATIGFVFHIYFYVRHGRKRASDRYDKDKENYDYMKKQYEVLEDMYGDKESDN